MTLQLFLQTKLKQSVVSFHLHSHRTPNQLDPLLKLHLLLLSPSLRRKKYPNFSSPAILQHVPLDPIPSHLLQTISPRTLTSTHTHYQHISPHRHLPHCIQAGSSNPTAQKTYIKHFSFRKLQDLSLSFHSLPKHSNDVVFNQVSCFFHRTTNWTLNSQVSGVAIQLRLLYYRSLKPCELQKPIPNHQSSFCWISLPLLTLSIIRSSCPPSHHWISLGFHFAGLNPISLVGLSGWPGAGRYPKHINWSLGFPRARFLDPLLFSTYITSLAPIIQAHGFSYHFYADNTQLYRSFRQMIQR